MLFAIKNREDLESLEEKATLKNRVKELHLQEKWDKQIFLRM